MRLDVISIFPDYLAGPLRVSLLGKAVDRGLLDLRLHDLRDWTTDRHRTVDDTPYGGGAGMVMRPEPWGAALDDGGCPRGARRRGWSCRPRPGGRSPRRCAAGLAAEPWLVFACGRYEGIDQRVVEHAASRMPVDEVSIGDYVLAGGEAAVLVIVEAVARLLPGVLGNPESLAEESHAGGLLEYPVYTRPPAWRGLAVPEVLLSGDHAAVARWRRDQSLAPDRRSAAPTCSRPPSSPTATAPPWPTRIPRDGPVCQRRGCPPADGRVSRPGAPCGTLDWLSRASPSPDGP